MAVLVLLTAVLSWFLVYLYTRWAVARGVLDIPNARSSHARPVPRGGGLVIVVLVSAAMLLLGRADWGGQRLILPAVLAAGIAAISFLDDLKGVPIMIRLFAQIGSALAILWWIRTHEMPLIPLVESLLLGGFLLVLWVVGFTNAFNFMDGIDGIAATQALIAALWWMLASAAMGGANLWLSAVVVGSCVGFLAHNWPPAGVFMGDVGSAFLGFTIASMSVIDQNNIPNLSLCIALCVWPFIADTTGTLVMRIFRREPFLKAHSSHVYQRLVQSGFGHQSVTLLYGALAVAGGAVAFILRHHPRALLGALIFFLIGGTTLLHSLRLIVRRRGGSPPQGQPAGDSKTP